MIVIVVLGSQNHFLEEASIYLKHPQAMCMEVIGISGATEGIANDHFNPLARH